MKRRYSSGELEKDTDYQLVEESEVGVEAKRVRVGGEPASKREV